MMSLLSEFKMYIRQIKTFVPKILNWLFLNDQYNFKLKHSKNTVRDRNEDS